MPEAFKEKFSVSLIQSIADGIAAQAKGFNAAAFVDAATENLAGLELKQRSNQITLALDMHLQGDFSDLCDLLVATLTPMQSHEAYFDEHHWLVRSRHHAKVGLDPEHIGIGEVNRYQGGFAFYASACAQELARAHCRGDRFSLDYEKSMAKYIEDHKVALLDSAQSYAQQVIKDWQYLCEREGCS